MVIGGYTDPQGARTGFGALLLGVYDGKALRYAGKVGTGFDDRTLRALLPQLTKREQDAPSFVNPPRGYAAKGAHWVRPELVAEVAFTEWSADGALRHPSFQGLRADKKASEVVREKPMEMPHKPATSKAAKAGSKRGARAPRGETAGATYAGVPITHPEKVYFPEAQLTKGDLVAYYVGMADWIVPHIAGRPLSLVRCPDGWPGECFYQKHAAKAVHAAVKRMPAPESSGMATYLSADSAAGARGPRAMGRDRAASVGLARAAARSSGPPDLRLRSRRRAALRGPGSRRAAPAYAALRGRPHGLSQDHRRQGAARRVADPRDAGVGRREGVHQGVSPTFSCARSRTGSRPRSPRSGARGRSSSTTCATPKAPPRSPRMASGLARTRRCRRRSIGPSSSATCASTTYNIRNVPERVRKLARDPWREFLDTKQSITAAMRKRFA